MIHNLQIFLEALLFIYLARLTGALIINFRFDYSIIGGLGTLGLIGLALAAFGIFYAPAIWFVWTRTDSCGWKTE